MYLASRRSTEDLGKAPTATRSYDIVAPVRQASRAILPRIAKGGRMPKWEYLYVIKQRGWKNDDQLPLDVTKWRDFVVSGTDKTREWTGDFCDLLEPIH